MKKITVITAFLLLAACSNNSGIGPKQQTGSILGATAGGLAGDQLGGGTGRLAATAAGVLLGASFGSNAGRSLDRADALYSRSYGSYSASTFGYAAPPTPAYQAPAGYVAPAMGAPYAVPSYGTSGSFTSAIAPQIPSGCQRVGGGIWCEQSNGTFNPY